MNKSEKANRRAKEAIIQWLVTSEQPKSNAEALALISEFESTPYPTLLEVKAYTLAKRPHTNASQRWFMDLCIEAAKNKTSKQEQEVNA